MLHTYIRAFAADENSNKKVRCPVSKSARNMQFSIKDCDSYRFSLMQGFHKILRIALVR